MFKHLKKPRHKYQIAVAILTCVLLFFIITAFALPDLSQVKHSKLGTTIDGGTRKVQLIDETYYQDRHLLEMNFYSPIVDAETAKNLKVVVSGEEDVTKTWKKVNESYYVLFIENIPQNWKTIKVKIVEKDSDNSIDLDVVDPFYVAAKKVKEKDKFKPKKMTYYQAKEIDLFIKDSQKTIGKNEKSMTELKQSNKKIVAINQDLEGNLSYQTVEKMDEMKATIQSNEQKIASQKEDIEKLKSKNKEVKKAIEKAKKQKKLLNWLDKK